MVSDVTLRLSFRRSQDDFVTISETAAKKLKSMKPAFLFD